MEAFLLALIPPALWSVTNHIDKYLLTKYFKGGGVGALMLFSSFIGLLLLPIILLIHPEVLSTFEPRYLLISFNAFFYILASLPYFYALVKDDASVAVPLFQLVPVFTYFLSYIFLGETLSLAQTIGGLIIIFGAMLISLELKGRNLPRVKGEILGLMALSSLFFAVNFLFFKYFALEVNFWVTSFWEYIGFSIFAFLLVMFVRSYRREFINVIKENSIRVLTFNGINELINIAAKTSFNFVSLLMPITLTWIVNGFQPFFIFIYGILLTVFFPKISQENITRQVLFQKIVAIIIMFIGGIVINT